MSHSSLGAQVWHVLTRDHTVLPATHTFIHKWNEPYLPLTACRKVVAALWLVLISRPAEGRRLSWPGWLALGIHIPIGLRVENRRELTEAEPWTVDSNVLFTCERVGTQRTLLHRVSKNVPPLACYNFDTHINGF